MRLHALRSLAILDTQRDPRFDSITSFCAFSFDVPICIVSLIDTNRLWFKSAQGVNVKEVPRNSAICSHVINEVHTCEPSDRVYEIHDTKTDSRFSDSPFVVNEPWVRSYIGFVLQSASGMNIGTLSVVDTKIREFSNENKKLLILLGTMVENLINGNPFSSGIEQEIKQMS